MSKWPASSNTVQCGRSGSTGTSSVDVSHSGPVRLRKTASIRVSSPASVSIVVSYEPMPIFYHPRRPVSGALTGHSRLKFPPHGCPVAARGSDVSGEGARRGATHLSYRVIK
jgi:hypothetical protein